MVSAKLPFGCSTNNKLLNWRSSRVKAEGIFITFSPLIQRHTIRSYVPDLINRGQCLPVRDRFPVPVRDRTIPPQPLGEHQTVIAQGARCKPLTDSFPTSHVLNAIRDGVKRWMAIDLAFSRIKKIHRVLPVARQQFHSPSPPKLNILRYDGCKHHGHFSSAIRSSAACKLPTWRCDKPLFATHENFV